VQSLDSQSPTEAMNADGSVGSIKWSPEGQFIYYSVYDGASTSLVRYDVVNGETAILQVLQGYAYVDSISPDGNWLILIFPGCSYCSTSDLMAYNTTDSKSFFINESGDCSVIDWK
jgi:Tol biopolymer transport system component